MRGHRREADTGYGKHQREVRLDQIVQRVVLRTQILDPRPISGRNHEGADDGQGLHPNKL